MGYRAYDAPVEEGEQYEVDIKKLSRRDDGLARVDGFVIFASNTRLGNHVRIEILQVNDRFAIGERIERAPSQG
jgi:predicted RNA-binding protein with TRAM domain